MSVAAVHPVPVGPPVMSEAEKYGRMCTVWDWLQGLGLCRLCGLGIALMQVEKEAGNPTWQPHLSCEREGSKCKEIARDHWKELPRKSVAA